MFIWRFAIWGISCLFEICQNVIHGINILLSLMETELIYMESVGDTAVSLYRPVSTMFLTKMFGWGLFLANLKLNVSKDMTKFSFGEYSWQVKT